MLCADGHLVLEAGLELVAVAVAVAVVAGTETIAMRAPTLNKQVGAHRRDPPSGGPLGCRLGPDSCNSGVGLQANTSDSNLRCRMCDHLLN